MITSHDLNRFGKQASSAYLSNSEPLNGTIEKIASENGLNFHQISRVVESANTDTYLQMMKTAEDNYVDFPLADAKEVHGSITNSTEKVASLDDYDLPPSKMDTVGSSDFEKTASEHSTRSLSQIEKDAKYIEGVHTFLIDESHGVRANFIDTYDKV
ncbi:hypothetical protein H8D85_01625 [bacterium]|nr:hypothetical protein [bacterium]